MPNDKINLILDTSGALKSKTPEILLDLIHALVEKLDEFLVNESINSALFSLVIDSLERKTGIFQIQEEIKNPNKMILDFKYKE
jgi:hypothetical protein